MKEKTPIIKKKIYILKQMRNKLIFSLKSEEMHFYQFKEKKKKKRIRDKREEGW